jgi:small conductance mechanosensitive channel
MDLDRFFASVTDLAVNVGGKIIFALVILLIGWLVAGWVGRVSRAAMARARFDETLAGFLTKLVSWGVMVLVILACFSLFGVETTSFAAIIGSAGIAVGLAFQGTLSNFAAGLMLLAFRPFKVGDVIQVAGQLGKVHAIELFTTTLDSFDNRRFTIPNGQIFGSTIENVTFHRYRRADVNVGVGYEADIDATRRILTEAVQGVPAALTDPEPEIVLLELGGSSVNWSVRVWANTADFGEVKQATIRGVKIALDQGGIEIPFPQMDVHLKRQTAVE